MYKVTAAFKERVKLVERDNQKLATRLRLLARHYGNADAVYSSKSGKFIAWRFMEGDTGGCYLQNDYVNFEITVDLVLETFGEGDVNDAVAKAMEPHLVAADKAKRDTYARLIPDVFKTLTRKGVA